MKIQDGFAIMLTGLLLAAATTWAGVTTDYDRHANFADYKTYSWGKVQTANGLWDDRVKHAIDQQLAAKGQSCLPARRWS